LRLLPALIARIAVGGRRHHIGETFLIEGLHQLNLQLHRSESAARLGQATALGLGLAHHPGQSLVIGKREMIIGGLVEIDLRAGRPTRQILGTQLCEQIIGDLFSRERPQLLIQR